MSIVIFKREPLHIVTLVTVLVQGTSIGPLIRMLKLRGDDDAARGYLTEPQSAARLEAAQFTAVQAHAHDDYGQLLHPRLLEQYGFRAQVAESHKDEADLPPHTRAPHFNLVLAAVAAGRAEMLHLNRSGLLQDELLRSLEHDPDVQEISALHSCDG